MATEVFDWQDGEAPGTLAQDPLGDFARYAVGVLEQYPSMCEERVKTWLIPPFFRAIGWESEKQWVLPEEQVQIGVGIQHADYVLLDETGRRQVVVEVKAPAVEIDDQVVNQGVSYAIVLGAPLVILTNGRVVGAIAAGSKEKLFSVDITDLARNRNISDIARRVLRRGGRHNRGSKRDRGYLEVVSEGQAPPRGTRWTRRGPGPASDP